MASINRVVLVGNLTRDPELRQTPNGTSVCTLGLAVNDRYKQGDEWVERVNFFDVIVWGAQAENCERYLSKGRPVAVDGRLSYRTWEAQDGGKRSKVEVVAQSVQFLGSRQDSGSSPAEPAAATAATGSSGLSPDTSDFEQQPSQGTDDDIPF